MRRIQPADGAQIATIYRESYPLWGIGLSRDSYLELWNDIRRTRWAEAHARFLVRADEDGSVLSSLKCYRPSIRLDGQPFRATVLGAIFTPRSRRRQGHAAALIRALIEDGRAAGDPVAMLFSDIHTGYYEAFGFLPVPATEHWGPLPRRDLPRGWSISEATPADSPSIRQAHLESQAHRRLAFVRDAAHWDFLTARTAAYCRRTHDPDVEHRTEVVRHEGSFVGYVTSVAGRGEWNVREVAARRGDGASVAEVLSCAADSARRRGLRRYYGWLPPEALPHLDGWKLRGGPRRRAIPMICVLDPTVDAQALVGDPSLYFPYQDQF